MEDILIPLIAIICSVGLPILLGMIAAYMSIKSRHEERLAMIEKGVPIPQPVHVEKKPNRYPALRNGMFMVGIACGIFIGIFVSPYMPDESDWADMTVPTLAILFGGISFIVYFFVSRSLLEKEKKQDELHAN